MLLEKFNGYVKRNRLCSTGDKILLAVSGGVDSMVMLSLFARSGFSAGVAHCNFQLRGDESDEDEVLVEEEAARYNMPFYNQRFETMVEVANSGDSLQMVARRQRYGWFDALCREHGYTHIAIAHQADDSVETFFINLLRGTGLRGLTGINVINGKVIRPLLFSPRREIVEYAVANKIPYREDSSNSSTKYLRNKIRLGIVPRIREISPQFTDTMTDNVERLTEALSFIDAQMEMIRAEVVEVVETAGEGVMRNERVTINISRINPSLPLKFVIYELINDYGFNGEVIESLYRSMNDGGGTGKRFYSRDRVAYIDREQIIITPIEENDTCTAEIEEDTVHLCACGCLFKFEHLDTEDIENLHQDDNVALLDEGMLKYPLTIRRWREGDSFVPFGMRGHKKVSDYLIDKKVSVWDKKRQLVITSGDDIVWLVDRRIDDRYKIESSVKNVLRITRIIQ